MFDKYQREAIETINGPVLCAAGPGSGKTTVVVNRTLNMVNNGVDPSSILVMTFTQDAAKEMATRYAALKGSVAGPSFCTIHSFAYKVCRDVYQLPGNSVLSNLDKAKFVKNALKTLGCYQSFKDIKRTTESLLGEFEKYALMDDLEREGYKSLVLDTMDFLTVFKMYKKYKEKNKKVDFTDMLIFCRKALENERIKEHYQETYKYFMVDEFQDTSKIQAEIIYTLAEKYRNIFVCGDDDQSIYGFRNARPDIMISFPKKYPGCKEIVLSVNYRSEKGIVDAAQKLIKNNKIRIEKDISGNKKESGLVSIVDADSSRTQNETLGGIIKEAYPDTDYKEMAVLCRTNKEISVIARYLSDKKIPFNTKERIENIHETWVYDTLIAYIKIAYNVADENDWKNAARKPSRYFKNELIEKTGGKPDRLIKMATGYSKKNAYEYKDDIEMVKDLAKGSKNFKTVTKKIARFLAKTDWIKNTCDFQKLDPHEYQDVHDELLLELEDFSDIESYLDYVERSDSELEHNVTNLDENGVTIATIHRSKGREWDIVMIPSVNNGNIPYMPKDEPWDAEEERRLFYVAITRARKACYICFLEEKTEEERKKDTMEKFRKGEKSGYLAEIEPKARKEKSERKKHEEASVLSLPKSNKFDDSCPLPMFG